MNLAISRKVNSLSFIKQIIFSFLKHFYLKYKQKIGFILFQNNQLLHQRTLISRRQTDQITAIY